MTDRISSRKPYEPPTLANLGKATDLTKGVPIAPNPDVAAISK